MSRQQDTIKSDQEGKPSSTFEHHRNQSIKKRIRLGFFKLINLVRHFMPIKKSLYIVILLIEFLIISSFLLQKIQIQSISISGTQQYQYNFGDWVNYISIQQVLIQNTNESESYVCLSIILLVLTSNYAIQIILCKYTNDGYQMYQVKSFSKTMLQISGAFQMILLKIGIIPIYNIFLSHFLCAKFSVALQENQSQAEIINYYYGYECWTTQHAILIIIVLAFILITTVYIMACSLTYNDPRPDSDLSWSASPSRAEFIKTIFKLVIPIGYNLKILNAWIYLIFQIAVLLLALLICHQRYKYFFHVQKKILIATVAQEASILWLAFATLILDLLLTSITGAIFAYLIVSLLIFDILYVIIFLQLDLDKNLSIFPSLEKEEQYQQFFLKFHQYLQKNDFKTINKAIIFGLIKHHQNVECEQANCACENLYKLMSGNKLEIYLEQFDDRMLLQIHQSIQDELIKSFDIGESIISPQNQDQNIPQGFVQDIQHKKNIQNDPKLMKQFEMKFSSFLYKFYYQLLCNVIQKKFQKSNSLRLLQIALLKNQLNNEFKAYFQIMEMLTQKPQLEWHFYLYQSQQKVERIMYNKYQLLMNNKQGIDVIKVYEFEKMFLQFERQVINTANNCLNFWKELIDNKTGFNVTSIHNFGVQIANSYTEVSELTNKMLEKFPNHIMLLKIYAYFLSDVMNNEIEGKEIATRVKSYYQNQTNLKHQEENSQDQIKFFGYNTKTAIITMTVSLKDLGTILNANFETKSLLGYKNSQLRGKNVKVLMPKILADNHDQFLQNYFETAQAKILEKQRIVLGKNKQGFVFPIHIVVKAIPNLKRGLIFVGFIKKVDESDPFLQPPSTFAGQDYHLIIADSEGQIYGFTENCWETFGFRPQFFFNRFGDPEQQIKMEKIIKNLKNAFFLAKLESKKDGVFCSLDTVNVLEYVSKELLTKDEQEILSTISGSYNVNLQIQEMKFADGKINLKIYKVLKVSRIIRSQNVLDMIQSKVNEVSEDSLDGHSSTESQHNAKELHGFRVDSIDIEDDISESSYGRAELSERSVTSTINISDVNNTSKYLRDFKKSISNKSMPASIKKLNMLVIILMSLIFVISILDLAQALKFFEFTINNQKTLQLLFKKQDLISTMTSNILTIVMINQNIQPNNYQNISDRISLLVQEQVGNIAQLENIENTLQSQTYSALFYKLDNFYPNMQMKVSSLNLDTSVINEEQTMRFIISQYISKMQNILVTLNSTKQLQMTPEIYKLQNYQYPQNRSQVQKDLYFLVENTISVLGLQLSNQTKEFYDSIDSSISIYLMIIIIQFSFCGIFILLSGIVVFPIVIGVQKNKVMILSIYFELPQHEIERAFRKCLYFMAKIESKLDDQSESKEEAQYAKKIIEYEEKQKENESKDFIEKISSSISSRRQLMNGEFQDFEAPDSLSYQFRREQSIDESSSQLESRTPSVKNLQIFNRQIRLQDVKINLKGQSKAQDQKQSQINRSQIFKDIKVKNNKINIIKFLVILIFLIYFATSFGVNKMYIQNIEQGIEQQYELYSEKQNLQLAFLFFNQEVMRNETISQKQSSPTLSQFQIKIENLQKLQGYKENLKKGTRSGLLQGQGFDFIDKIDSDKFCLTISKLLKDDFTKKLCPQISNGIFTFGHKQAIYAYLYQLQQLHIKFNQTQSQKDINSNKTQNPSSQYQQLIAIINDSIMIEFSIVSNIYLEASFQAMLLAFQESIDDYYKKIYLFVKLKFAFFVVFTLFILIVVWRVFLKRIQAEIFRSKGMLNMIPMEFLEQENNFKSLSINKLIDISKE